MIINKTVQQVLQENIYKSISAKTDLDNYFENDNPDSSEDNKDLYRLNHLNEK